MKNDNTIDKPKRVIEREGERHLKFVIIFNLQLVGDTK